MNTSCPTLADNVSFTAPENADSAELTRLITNQARLTFGRVITDETPIKVKGRLVPFARLLEQLELLGGCHRFNTFKLVKSPRQRHLAIVIG